MKDFLIIGLLVLAGGILLLSIIIMFISKKIKIIKPMIVYIILVLFPIILLVIPTALVSPMKGNFTENLSLSIPRCIYSMEILLTLVVIFIVVNMFSGYSFADKKNIDYSFKKITTGVRFLHYSIFGNILYILPTFISMIYTFNYIFNNPTQTAGSIFSFFLIWGTLLFGGLAQVYVIAGICIISIMTLAIIFFITSINGTIRITSVVVQNKKLRNIYIISMGLPVINIFSMLFLCYSAKNKLNN